MCRPKMALPAVFAIVPIGILFMISGFIVNLLQAIFFIIVRPFSKCMYRRINKVIAELLWLELIWLVDWWACLKIQLYADDKTFQSMGKEHALVLCNHRSDIDWLIGWVLAQRSGCLGTSLAVMKKEALYLPILGWSMWFSDYVFLERRWDKDETTLKSGFKRLANFPMPFWLALFVEGTRFTQAKLQAAQEFAIAKGLPVPRNVLLPRTKGFVSAVGHMRSFVPAIYDCTLAVPSDQPAPTMLGIFKGQSSVINVQIRRHPMQELPETADGISQWCKDLFVTKDAVLERYRTMDTFSDQDHQDIGRPVKSLIVMIGWSGLVGFGVIWLIRWLLFLGTWQIVSFSVTFLVLVTIMMHLLIHSSESEQTTPPRMLNSVPELSQSLLPT